MAGNQKFQTINGIRGLSPPSEKPIDPAWEAVEKEIPACRARLPAKGPVHFPADAPIAEVVAAMGRDGTVVIERAVSEETCDRIIAEMDPYMEVANFGDSALGRQTKRLGAVPSRSPASWEVIQHPLLLKLCEGVLGRQLLGLSKEQLEGWLAEDPRSGNRQFPFQLSLSQIICIGPGNKAQGLHRDGETFLFNFRERGLEVEISTIWALQDFSEEIGATRVVPGSHRWAKGRTPEEAEVVQAVMPKGSVVIYLGSTFHSGGENRSQVRRWGLNVDYNLASLRQEENMFLACPPEIAANFPPDLQALVGYTMPASSLGYVGEIYHPRELLEETGHLSGKPINWASRHLPELRPKL